MRHLNQSGAASRQKEAQQGFSLIELLIVIAIILIIAAIAIPNFLRAKIASHESSAVSSLRTINTSESAYFSTYGVGYATFAQLSTPGVPCAATAATACLIDPVLSAGTKSGYTFTAFPVGAGGPDFVSSAVPLQVGATGQRTFCVDETGAVHMDPAGGAAPADDVGCEALAILQ
jgi:type IV pilus assembly protein PilA